jgi:hypothetical protein
VLRPRPDPDAIFWMIRVVWKRSSSGQEDDRGVACLCSALPKKNTLRGEGYDTLAAALDIDCCCACHFFISSTICFFIWAGVGSAIWVATYQV